MQIPYINLAIQHRDIKDEILARISGVIDSGQFILGDELSAFEKSFAAIAGTTYAVGVANGTDSLFLIMRALGIGPGDEVITPPNSYLASASSVAIVGATPVFADVRGDYNLDPAKAEAAITPKTKAIIAVHLTGRPADMDAIMALAKKHNLHVIEDCAQSVGAKFNNQFVGSFGIAGSFSLHPLKNLAACGDGGVISTSDEKLYQKLLVARNHGLRNRDECDFWSYNSRLDNLQAAILNVKLTKLAQWTARRRHIATYYADHFEGLDLIAPRDTENEYSVYHTFIIQSPRRDALKQYLADKGVDTKVHYPIPIHYQQAAAYLGYKRGDFPVTERQAETILSLPVYPELTDAQVEYIAAQVQSFHKQ
jgi:dTDP-4-amino-4,6-dideoxygalactose transaminase